MVRETAKRVIVTLPREVVRAGIVGALGRGSSFDNRDGTPALLDDLLPLKAQIVEQLDPLSDNLIPMSEESLPNGWGSQPRDIRSPLK